MSLLTEQLSSATQNQIATQISFFQALSQSAFGGLEKLIALNLSIAKQSMDNANQVTRELMAVTEPRELMQFGRVYGQPSFEKLMSYGRELATISRDTRAGIWQAVTPGSLSVSTVISPAGVHVDIAQKPKTVSKTVEKTTVVESPKQLALLAESEPKLAKTAKVVAKAKPVVNKAEAAETRVASKVVATAKLEKEEPQSTVVKKIATKTPATPVTEKKAPAVKTAKAVTAAKPASVTLTSDTAAAPAAATTEQATPQKTAAVTPISKKPVVASKVADSKKTALASDTEEKKSAVKFPFPAVNKSKTGTPAFPKAAAKPAYKAKSSAATGAKKPVRQ